MNPTTNQIRNTSSVTGVTLSQALDTLKNTEGGSIPSWESITNKPSVFPPELHLHPEKQDTLINSVNIKTINGSSILGSGDLVVSGGGGGGVTDHGALTGLGDDDHTQYLNNVRGDARYSSLGHSHAIADVTGLQTAIDGKQATLVSGTNIKTINGVSITGSGDVEVGYRNIPQNSQSVAYTAVLEDSGKHILHPSADTTARTFTIPANVSVAYPIGTALTFINQNAAGAVTIAITSDTMRLAGAGTTGSRTLAANGIATAIKLTSTEWIISGTGLT